MNLIGKKVRNKKDYTVGTIVKLEGDIITISYHGEYHNSKYPEAFDNFLELEDSVLQKKLEETSSIVNFNEFKKQYIGYLDSEIRYLKGEGQKKYRAFEGVFQGLRREKYVYSFEVEAELNLPEGTIVKLKTDEGWEDAQVLSCEEYYVMLLIKSYIGKDVFQIEFKVSHWYLLDQLRQRLMELDTKNNSIAYKLACKGRSGIDPMGSMTLGQNAAMKKATEDEITFVWGPPGTGKTETLAKIALEAIDRGERVLMLSYSNVSVDGALLRINNKSDYSPGTVLRYGHPKIEEIVEHDYATSYKYAIYKNPDLAEEYNALQSQIRKLRKNDINRLELKKQQEKIRRYLREEEKAAVRNAAFIATTVTKATVDELIYSQSFDVVIFDEASMAYVPQIVFAGSLAKKNFICLGDFRQLPAIVQNSDSAQLSVDIFEHTGITSAVEMGYGHKWLVMLNVQYRMHSDIADHVSDCMYNGYMLTHDDIMPSRNDIANSGPLKTIPMGIIDLSYMYSACVKRYPETSHVNVLSAMISMRLAEIYANDYEVAIITPYNAQSRLILSMIRDAAEKDEKFKRISAATVHQFQGSEKPIVIYDVVDCYREPYPGSLLTTIKNDTADRLFNVALTRAQGKFLMVVNRDYMDRKKVSPKLLFTKTYKHIYDNDSIIAGDEIIEYLSVRDQEIPALIVGDRDDDNWDTFIEDLKNAKSSIHIEMAGPLADDEHRINSLREVLDKKNAEGVGIKISVEPEVVTPKSLRKYASYKQYVVNPITIIDSSKVWFGHPLCEADFQTNEGTIYTEYFPVIRFEGKHTARFLKTLL